MTKLYTYKHPILHYLLVIALFYFITKTFISKSSNGSPFYAFCAVLSLVMVVACVYFLILRFTLRHMLKVDENQIIVPKRFYSKDYVTISYKDILGFKIKTYKGKQILHITYTKGKISIEEFRLPDKKSFDEIYMIIVEKVQKVKQDGLNDAKENSND